MPHLQIRNVPGDVHRTLKIRAAKAGMSLSEYLLKEIERSARRPTVEEWVEGVRTSKHLVYLETRPADIIREERESR
jgi:plasmid stability protein